MNRRLGTSNRNNKFRESAKVKSDKRKRLISPTYPNQYGTVALIDSDWSPKLIRALGPYNTIGNQNFFWRASFDANTVTQVPLADAPGAYSVSLSQFAGSGDLTAVFDQYRLKAVSYMISPNSTFTNGTGASVISPRFWSAIDYDDGSVPSRSVIEQYDTVVVTPPNCGVIRTFVPHQAIATYSTVFTSFGNVEDLWIDVASPNVQHYGLKFVVENGVTGQTILQSYSISITGFFEFRATR